jgi:predicted CXXCH cytochrome family protein
MLFSTRPNAQARHRGGSERNGLGPPLLLLLILVCLTSVWSGCTAEKKYKILSIFFDGVPDPNAPVVDANTAEVTDAGGKPVRVILHKPYADNNCAVCHGTAQDFADFTKIPSSICVKCHRKVVNQYPVMHGPVSAVECTWCHTPHESQIEHLLKMPAPDVCVQCHEPALLPTKVPEHLIAEKSCLDCHVAHGGAKHGLLRPVIAMTPTIGPTMAPTSAPAPTTGGSQ